jgi:spermidine synthase
LGDENSKKPLDLWAEEPQNDVLLLRYRVLRTLFSAESEFQRVDVVETAGFGRMLFNDGLAMVSERDEFVYHEMIAHVPLFVHPLPRKVLVIGGGDGGTVREVLRHPEVRHCRLVEIDPCVLEACREYLPQMSAALGDSRVQVTVGDGVRFVAETDFYRDVRRVLTERGVAVSQAESPFYESAQQRSLLEILRRSFPRVHLYNYSNLIYPGGLWSFSFASRGDLCPVGDLDADRVTGSGIEFRYYSESVHRAAFVLPAFQRASLGDLLSDCKRSPP